MCEEKASQELAKLGGSFWEGGVEAVELGVQDTAAEEDEVNEGEWETEVSATLDNLKGVAVLEGYVTVSFHLLLILTALYREKPSSRSPIPRFTAFYHPWPYRTATRRLCNGTRRWNISPDLR